MNHIQLKRVCKGIYTDLISNRYLELKNGVWEVSNDCTGEVYFSSKRLKDCKSFVSSENEILLWNN